MGKKDKYVHSFVWTEGFYKGITSLVKQMGKVGWAWRNLSLPCSAKEWNKVKIP